jgi:DNA-binding SARP family transcriptional activator/tetratricopeptide (TPR) repeat protein
VGSPAATRPGGITLHLAGSFAAQRGGGADVPGIGSRKARTLLKLLAVERGRVVAVDRIVAVLWGRTPPRRAEDNVASLVSRLRAWLGPAIVAGGRDGYRLGPAPEVVVDLDVAAAQLAAAARRLSGGEAAAVAAVAGRVLELLGSGDALPEDRDEDWARPARTQAADLVRQARHLAAQAALSTADAAAARDLAGAAVAADSFDETAHRLLMSAQVALGEPARALSTYERLRAALADEFGTDPAPETRAVHLSILREERRVAVPASAPGPRLAGRAAEVGRLADAWHSANAARPALVLISGEAGIGKTRLAAEAVDLARRSGGAVISARCYATESSLFLQPFVDALDQHAAGLPAALIRSVAGPALAELLPSVAAVTGDVPASTIPAEFARRRAYEAVSDYLSGIAARQPVLLLLDDLHNAGLATVELLHYLARHAHGRLLLLATVRDDEGARALRALTEVATQVELGPLPPDAVITLAADAGQAHLASHILGRTGGHTLFVVETLRALAAGRDGIPASLQAAVLARVAGAGGQVEELLRAAAVLGATIDPDVIAQLLALGAPEVGRRCEQALTARLLVVADRTYEFTNDLVREVLYATTPAPTRVAYHRRASDLLTDRPEQVAAHALAAGDADRAARAYLLAGEQAGRRFAAADAEALLTHAVDVALLAGVAEVAGRAYLARGRVREALTEYPTAMADFHAAVDTARHVGDRRLEMLALRELGGDVPISLRLPITECVTHLSDGLAIAESLADRTMEAELLSRLAIISGSRLRFSESLSHAHRAVRAARAGNDERALAAALDGLKNSWAYLGEVDRVAEVTHELEPLLRGQNDLWRLQWTLYESAFAAIAAARWDDALAQVQSALELNRRSGYRAYEGWFVGNLGRVHRLRGDYDEAVACGRRAYALTSESIHPWWRVTACAELGGALLAAGAHAEAVAVLEEGCAQGAGTGAEASLVRCLGPLAAATGDPALLARADAMVAGIDAPPGSAWLYGADAYLWVARAWLWRGEPARTRSVIAPLLAAANRVPWRPIQVPILLLDAEAVTALGGDATAPLAAARQLARQYGFTHLLPEQVPRAARR